MLLKDQQPQACVASVYLRPTSYDCKLCTPMPGTDTSNAASADNYFGSNGVFRKAPVVLRPVTEPDAHFPKTKDLVVVEDLDQHALPGSMDETSHASQPEKVVQLGTDGWKRLTMGIASDLCIDQRHALLFVDLTVRTAEMPRSLLENRRMFGCPLYVYGLCDGDMEHAFVAHTIENAMVDAILDGS